MATQSLEERVATLERKVARILPYEDAVPQTPWWKRLVGIYRDDPEFDEAERLGREYRASLREPDSDKR